MLSQQSLEGRKMALLCLGHAADLASTAATPQNIELPAVDPGGAELTGVIDAQHALDLRRGRRVAGQAVTGCRRHIEPRRLNRRRALYRLENTAMQIAAMTSEASKFKPASETPNNVHAGWSHCTGCARIS